MPEGINFQQDANANEANVDALSTVANNANEAPTEPVYFNQNTGEPLTNGAIQCIIKYGGDNLLESYRGKPVLGHI